MNSYGSEMVRFPPKSLASRLDATSNPRNKQSKCTTTESPTCASFPAPGSRSTTGTPPTSCASWKSSCSCAGELLLLGVMVFLNPTAARVGDAKAKLTVAGSNPTSALRRCHPLHRQDGRSSFPFSCTFLHLVLACAGVAMAPLVRRTRALVRHVHVVHLPATFATYESFLLSTPFSFHCVMAVGEVSTREYSRDQLGSARPGSSPGVCVSHHQWVLRHGSPENGSKTRIKTRTSQSSLADMSERLRRLTRKQPRDLCFWVLLFGCRCSCGVDIPAPMPSRWERRKGCIGWRLAHVALAFIQGCVCEMSQG